MYLVEAFDVKQWKRWIVGFLHTSDPQESKRFCNDHSGAAVFYEAIEVTDLDAKPLPKTMWVASWLPSQRPKANENDDETPRFGLRHMEDGAYEEAAGWVQNYIRALSPRTSQTVREEISAALQEEDWRAVVSIYNQHNDEGWYIYISETPVGVQSVGVEV